MKQTTTLTTRLDSPWGWLALALAAQMGWGAYPVLLRYLQTVSGLPGLSLLAMGNLIVLLLVAGIILPRVDRRIFRLRIVWLFGLLVVLRGITNLLATRYTLAVYAQIIYLMTPFIVALLSRVVLKEQLPRHTMKALSIALVGALLIVSGDWGGTAVSTHRHDLWGILFAVLSSISLAFYMIVTRRSANSHASGEGLLLVHLLSLFAFSALASLLIGEDWGQWRALTPVDWLVFAALSLGVLLGANLGQIRSIQRLGAPVVSSMMAIRLVSALLFAGLLLGERLTSVWQLIGAGIIIVTITWYLRQA
ncbi:MAG TPA: DMT family transporter [Chloroflexota bacterium]|nr:DMT family transporter [Chloroflexota bacterium]HUM70951.1 DMT family transporter [Chloroflexota bacterium]